MGKDVNSQQVATSDVAKEVEIQVCLWFKKEDIHIIPLDDYDFVIGLEFLKCINAFLVPFTNAFCILDPQKECVVSVKHMEDLSAISPQTRMIEEEEMKG